MCSMNPGLLALHFTSGAKETQPCAGREATDPTLHCSTDSGTLIRSFHMEEAIFESM